MWTSCVVWDKNLSSTSLNKWFHGLITPGLVVIFCPIGIWRDSVCFKEVVLYYSPSTGKEWSHVDILCSLGQNLSNTSLNKWFHGLKTPGLVVIVCPIGIWRDSVCFKEVVLLYSPSTGKEWSYVGKNLSNTSQKTGFHGLQTPGLVVILCPIGIWRGSVCVKEVVLLYSLSTVKEQSQMWTSCIVWGKNVSNTSLNKWFHGLKTPGLVVIFCPIGIWRDSVCFKEVVLLYSPSTGKEWSHVDILCSLIQKPF